MSENQETQKNINNASKRNSTCSNDLRISWRITEKNFTSFCNCLKMVEYYVNAPKMVKNQETHINNIKTPLENFDLYQ